MAHQSENGSNKTTDESGNPIQWTEDTVHHHGVTEATTGNGTTHDTITGSGNHVTTEPGHKTHGTNGTGNETHGRATGPTGFAATTAGGQGRFLHHRLDGSSTSSEEDGSGGREVKTKEKLPAGVNSDHCGTVETPPADTISHPHEKKSTMDKTEEKLPASGNSDHSGTIDTPPADTIRHEKKGVVDKIEEKQPGGNSDHSGTSNTPPASIPQEKKSMMDKIKEKLPGHHEIDH